MLLCSRYPTVGRTVWVYLGIKIVFVVAVVVVVIAVIVDVVAVVAAVDIFHRGQVIFGWAPFSFFFLLHLCWLCVWRKGRFAYLSPLSDPFPSARPVAGPDRRQSFCISCLCWFWCWCCGRNRPWTIIFSMTIRYLTADSWQPSRCCYSPLYYPIPRTPPHLHFPIPFPSLRTRKKDRITTCRVKVVSKSSGQSFSRWRV